MKLNKLIALVLSFVMIATSAISTITVSAASDMRVMYEEDFEKTGFASLNISKSGDAVAEYVNDEDYGKSLHLKSGSGSVKFAASIGNFSKSGVLAFSVKYTSSVDWTSLYFGGTIISPYIYSGGLGMHLGSAGQPRYTTLTPNEWHDIEIHFDIPANSIDLYADNEKVASGVKFRTATAFNQWSVNVDKPNNEFYIDNIYFTASDATKGAPAASAPAEKPQEETKVEEQKPAEPEKVMYEAKEGETVTVAKADTFISFNSGTTAPQGKSGTVQVAKDNCSNEKISFFKFDAPEVPAGKKAYLNLWLQGKAHITAVPFGVYAVENNWDETLHYADDYIKIIDTVGSASFLDAPVKDWVKIDVTDYVRANAGKEISLSLRGLDTTFRTVDAPTLNFDSIQSVCQPNILVCDPIADLEIKTPEDKEAVMDAPVANKLSLSNLQNVRSLKEINMYVIGNDKADTTLYKDVYGDFAAKVAKATGAKVNYINKAYKGLIAADGKDKAKYMIEDQVPDLVVADFEGIAEAQAMDIVSTWRGYNRNVEFIFVAKEGSFNIPGTITIPRAKLLGAELTDAKGGKATSYVAEATKKWPLKQKPANEVLYQWNFDNFNGNNTTQQYLYEAADYYFNAEDDVLGGGGKYLHIKKDTSRDAVNTKFFAIPTGGNLRFDFQVNIINPETIFTINMWPTARDSFKMDSIMIDKLVFKTSTGTKFADLKANTWYNIAILYDMHTNEYDVVVNGETVSEGNSTLMTMGNIGSYEFDIAAGQTADFLLDGLRIGYYNDTEKPVEIVEEEDLGPAVLIDNDFEGISPGLIERGSSGEVSYVREDGNTFIRATRTGGNGSCSTIYKFGVTRDDVYLDLDFRLGDLSGSTKLMYIMAGGNFAVPIYFAGSKMQLNLSDSQRPVIKDGLEANVWYHLTIKTNLKGNEYTAFIDDEDCGTYGLLGNATFFDGVRVSISSGGASTYDVDNMKIERQNIIKSEPGESKYASAGGYDPKNTEAPANNAWIEKYRRNPSGEIYEAEDMKLTGYVKYRDLNFHNEYGIKVASTGAGMAEFTYNGESGYKQIDYGYLEEYGEEDSFFYLFQNGKLIDWICCQNDEVGRYNRTAKEWWYVAKGDKFTIRGTYGLEPSMLDYVEFNDGIKREFNVGDLVGEANRAQGYRLSSGWDVIEGNGWASNGLVLRDTTTEGSLNVERRLPEFYKPFLLEFQYTPYGDNKFDILLGNMTARKNDYAVKITIDGGDLIMGGKRYEGVVNEYGDTFFRFDIDSISGTYTAVANSVLVAENIPFDKKIDSFSVFRFMTDKDTKSYFKIYPFAIKAGYVMLEDFRCESDPEIELYNWNVEGKTVPSKDNAENIDPWHRVITSGTTISRSFRPQTGVITFETQIIFKSKKDGSRVTIGNSDGGEIALFTQGGDIWYDAGNGNTGIVWENFMKDVWYEYKLEIDLTNHKCDFFVNSFQKVSADITADMTKADFTKISSDAAAGDFWVDDIVVFNGTYNDDNEVPEPVAPEGYGTYDLVMQTCDMWREGTHFGYDCLHPWASRTPFLGYLEEGNPEVSDWQTKWMVEHGINVFSPCWYQPNDANSAPKNPRNGYSLDQGFMNSKYQDKIKFSIKLTYAGVGSGEENWLKYYVAYWIEHYFKHPSYWVVDNKPVIMCFNTSEFQAQFGNDNAAVLEKARQMCRDAGFDGAYFVACNGGTRAQGWDYSYKYAWNDIADGYAGAISEANKTVGDSGMAPYIFTMSQGWGHEAWGREGRKINMTLKDWKATLLWAKNVYWPAMDQTDPILNRTMTFGNWNEYCEGHTLAPSNLTGFGYLDMIREVMYPDAGPHEDIKPTKKFDQMSAMLW